MRAGATFQIEPQRILDVARRHAQFLEQRPRDAFLLLGQVVEKLLDYATEGAAFVFGDDLAKGKFIFIVGRVAGLTAEVAEEHLRERPMRIRIPVEYDGEPPRRPEQG